MTCQWHFVSTLIQVQCVKAAVVDSSLAKGVSEVPQSFVTTSLNERHSTPLFSCHLVFFTAHAPVQVEDQRIFFASHQVPKNTKNNQLTSDFG